MAAQQLLSVWQWEVMWTDWWQQPESEVWEIMEGKRDRCKYQYSKTGGCGHIQTCLIATLQETDLCKLSFKRVCVCVCGCIGEDNFNSGIKYLWKAINANMNDGFLVHSSVESSAQGFFCKLKNVFYDGSSWVNRYEIALNLACFWSNKPSNIYRLIYTGWLYYYYYSSVGHKCLQRFKEDVGENYLK